VLTPRVQQARKARKWSKGVTGKWKFTKGRFYERRPLSECIGDDWEAGEQRLLSHRIQMGWDEVYIWRSWWFIITLLWTMIVLILSFFPGGTDLVPRKLHILELARRLSLRL
jgi:hypothetical protein